MIRPSNNLLPGMKDYLDFEQPIIELQTKLDALTRTTQTSGVEVDFEREADSYALEQMAAAGIPASRFGDILTRMEEAAGGNIGDNGVEGRLGGFLSTHPLTSERLATIRAAR